MDIQPSELIFSTPQQPLIPMPLGEWHTTRQGTAYLAYGDKWLHVTNVEVKRGYVITDATISSDDEAEGGEPLVTVQCEGGSSFLMREPDVIYVEIKSA